MNIPPYQWRAEGGYQPPADGAPPFYPPAYLLFSAVPVPVFGSAPPPSAPPAAAAAAPGPVPGLKCEGGLRAGVNYLFPAKHTHIHLIRGLDEPWKSENFGKPFNFNIFMASSNWTVKDLIEQLGGNKEMSVTEVFEKGNGAWDKGVSIPYGDGKAGQVLSKLGWSEKRGKAQPPVWLVMHKT